MFAGIFILKGSFMHRNFKDIACDILDFIFKCGIVAIVSFSIGIIAAILEVLILTVSNF